MTYLQITPKSRSEIPEYVQMEQKVSQGAGRINGAYGEADWTPIRYVNRAYSRTALAGLYRGARVALVTPLRDGMNLVAKEYVAAQDPDDPGVLVLSRFAGAAHECKEALLVNPYDAEAVAAAINRALSMPLEERRQRHKAMYEMLVQNDIAHWAERFIATLTRPARNADWVFPAATRQRPSSVVLTLLPSSASRRAAQLRRRALQAPHRAASRSASPSRGGGSRPARLGFLLADDQQHRDFRQRVFAHLVVDLLVAQVEFDPQTRALQAAIATSCA